MHPFSLLYIFNLNFLPLLSFVSVKKSLAINRVRSACKLMAKQKVALECLSYHATAPQDQTNKLAVEPVKSAEEYKLYSFKFIGELIWMLIYE